jgi:predicted transcriptional regulator
MFNPLTPDLNDFSIDDLTNRLSKLNARMVAARKSGSQAVCNQVGAMIQETSEALAKRSTDLLKKNVKEDPKYDPKKDPENDDPLEIGE